MFGITNHEKHQFIGMLLLLGFFISFVLFFYYGFKPNGWFNQSVEEDSTNTPSTDPPSPSQQNNSNAKDINNTGQILLVTLLPLSLVIIIGTLYKFGFNFDRFYIAKKKKFIDYQPNQGTWNTIMKFLEETNDVQRKVDLYSEIFAIPVIPLSDKIHKNVEAIIKQIETKKYTPSKLENYFNETAMRIEQYNREKVITKV